MKVDDQVGKSAERDPNFNESRQPILITTSVPAEEEAVLRGIQGAEHVEVQVTGVGLAAAAASTAKALSKKPYRLVINMGIAGGFAPDTEIGSLVIATQMIAADLGAETPDGYLSLDELGFGSTGITVDPNLISIIRDAWQKNGILSTAGPILSVSTVTGTAETAQKLRERVPGAQAEAMEGFGVATAAQQAGIPVLEIRAISNRVGPRDRSSWRIKEALKQLETASATLTEVFS